MARSPDLGAIGAVRRAHGRPYVPRRPERTALHAVVRDHLETFLAERQARDRPLPRYAERALRGLLGCGDLASGFARFRCPDCRTERLVPFSCKDRGVCASCMSGRQTRIAAHLVDQVIPDVPVRQWVLSMPFWLRFRLAFDHGLTLAVHRVAARLIERFQRDRARRLLGVRGGEGGAVTVLQRFGSSCELNLHFHTVRPDGVFTVDRAGSLTFHRLPAPEGHELDHLVQAITAAVKRLLVRRGLSEDDGDAGQPTEDAVDEPMADLFAASCAPRSPPTASPSTTMEPSSSPSRPRGPMARPTSGSAPSSSSPASRPSCADHERIRSSTPASGPPTTAGAGPSPPSAETTTMTQPPLTEGPIPSLQPMHLSAPTPRGPS